MAWVPPGMDSTCKDSFRILLLLNRCRICQVNIPGFPVSLAVGTGVNTGEAALGTCAKLCRHHGFTMTGQFWIFFAFPMEGSHVSRSIDALLHQGPEKCGGF